MKLLKERTQIGKGEGLGLTPEGFQRFMDKLKGEKSNKIRTKNVH